MVNSPDAGGVMDTITGFVPTGQKIDRSARSKGYTNERSRRRPRTAGRALAGLILLLLGFCLLIFGGTVCTVEGDSMGEQVGRYSTAGRNPEYVVLSTQTNWTPVCAWMTTRLPYLS